MARRNSVQVTDLILATVFGLLMFLFTTSQWILFLASLNPIEGFLVYYAVLYAALLILSHLGLVIWKFKIDNPVKVFGALLITFAFFACVDWSSVYVQWVATGSAAGASQIFYQDEDGILFYLWNSIAGFSLEVARWFVIGTVFVIALIGGLLVTRWEY